MTTVEEPSTQTRALVEKYLNRVAARGRSIDAIQPRDPGERVPMSPGQKDVWLHAAMATQVPLYNEAFTIRRHGSFDREAFERAFAAIVRRHEAWRTTFARDERGVRQIVHPDLSLDIPFADLSRHPAGERERLALEMAAADARRPFDLAKLPLLRLRIVRLSPGEHRIYVALHHIIFDGVSIYRTVLPELARLYDAHAQGSDPGLAPPTLQYADYALWREREVATDPLRREMDYWRDRLAGPLPALKLPVDRPRPAQPSHRGGMETFALSAELSAGLKALSRREGVTLYVVLLAAFKVLMHRYSGQEDVIVGGVTDMRRRPELAGVVGYFLNGLALRTRPQSAMSFRDYLGQVSDAVLGALDASAAPFDRVVREVKAHREAGAHPIFQVLFSVQPPPPAVDAGWQLDQMDVTVGVAKFDLHLEVEERPGGLVGRFLYATDLFDAATIRRMVGHWLALLGGIVENPDCALGRLPLLTPEERRQLFIERNATARDCPQAMLPGWFETQARRSPGAIAVECRGERWRYRWLRRRVEQLARQLRGGGVGRGSLVAIMLERSPDMVAGLLATLRCGAAYLPLDPALPPARLAMIAEDARPAAVLTERALLGRLPETEASIILCDGSDRARDPGASAAEPVGPDDLAYVLYTSGSTGRPKAVEITHGSLVNLLAAMRDELAVNARDTLLAVTTLSFDIAALELFLPLVTGARLVLASREQASDPARLARLIAESGCSVMQATPATWRGLVAAGWTGGPRLRILCGGEALQPGLAARLLARSQALWNVYGPTETTIWSLIHKVRTGDDPVPIGRPLANTRTYVLDAGGEPVPDGVAGELYIGGLGLARGYRGAPALTASRFVEVAAVPGERLYRTGDVVRYRRDGLLEFHGRTDNQVKIRGFRVGLEEVEAAIATHPGIAAAALRTETDASGEASLVAFIVPKAEEKGRDLELRRYLGQILPGYMIPSRCVTVAALPMTPNGKVDRARLPAAPPEVRNEPDRISEPCDEIERMLARLWTNLLGVPAVGRDDDFFALGGHSLLAAMLAADIARETGREIPLAALFRAPTIATLADLLRTCDEGPFSHLVGLRPEGTGRPLFIVHGIFGNVLGFRSLVERLRTDRPVYAIQARGADPRQEPHASIAAMAEAYLAAMRERQPAGPYALAGYSFGGLIAYEMACRLRDAGEDVELLALIETDAHQRNLPFADWWAYQWVLTRRVFAKLRSLPPAEWPDYLLGKAAMIGHRFLLRLRLVEPGDPALIVPEAVPARGRQMYKIGVRQFIAYRPRRFPGKVTVFRTAEPAPDACDALPVWRKLAAKLEVHTIAGTHGTIMDEGNVDTLAFKLGACLTRLDRAEEGEAMVARTRAAPA